MELYITLIALYFLLLLISIDFKNFGLRKPFLFNFNLNATIFLAHFALIYFYVLGNSIKGSVNFSSIWPFLISHLSIEGNPQIERLGMAHELILLMLLPLYFSLFFNRRPRGYIFILLALAVSLYSVSGIYAFVDNCNYSFKADFTAINKFICTNEITKMMSDLESAKLFAPRTDEIRAEKFPDQVLTASSEIYLYMKRNCGWNNNLNMRMKHTVPLWHSKYTGVYAIDEREHHYYLKGGNFNDLTIYCDNVTSYEVESAIKKALMELKKMKK
ncbi:MAG TPA: hypothetical protein PKK26_05045 [Candidatus Wallbacteria bacterium]|nr:hypothetical protein [Candidatus Wallbacteria bacterium]